MLSIIALMPLVLLAPRSVATAEPQDEQFTKAAGALISSYVQIPLISEPVAAAASAASVTGDVASLITSALEATPVPAWFYGAIPAEYKTNIDAVIADISALRTAAAGAPTPTDTSGGATALPTAQQTTIVSTGTDSAGNAFTTSIVSAITSSPESASTSQSGSPASSATGAGSASESIKPTTTTSGNAAPEATAMPGRVVAGAAALVGFMAAL